MRHVLSATVQNVPGVLAHVDAGQLHQILWNLCENSLRHGQSGRAEPRVEITLGRAGRGGRSSLEVADRGPGIDPADLPHLFDRFYRAVAARSRPGSGLGLSIVRDVAESHGGRVFAENRPGGGACVGFVLPVA